MDGNELRAARSVKRETRTCQAEGKRHLPRSERDLGCSGYGWVAGCCSFNRLAKNSNKNTQVMLTSAQAVSKHRMCRFENHNEVGVHLSRLVGGYTERLIEGRSGLLMA